MSGTFVGEHHDRIADPQLGVPIRPLGHGHPHLSVAPNTCL
jgi:hypothetical protein